LLHTEHTFLERLSKIAANPFVNWSYLGSNVSSTTVQGIGSVPPPLAPMVTIPKEPAIQSGIDVQTMDLPHSRPGPKRGRKRPYSTISPEPSERTMTTPEPKIPRESKPDQVLLQEFYYATMQPERPGIGGKENKIVFNFKVIILSFLFSVDCEKII
jgi:hypothetical protein